MSQVPRRVAVLAVAVLTAVDVSRAVEAPREIRVDYADQSPPSLVLKRFGWIEQEFKGDRTDQ